MSSFDVFMDEDSTSRGPNKPFWSLDFEDNDAVLRWLNAEMMYLKEQGEERLLNQRKNLAVYRGIQYQTQNSRTREETSDQNTSPKRSKNPRVVYNHMVDMVEQDVARMTKYRGAVSVLPSSEEDSDRLVAKAGEKLVQEYFNKIDIDNLLQKHVRRKRIFGDDYIVTLWNKNMGPYDPSWLREVFTRSGVKENPENMSQAEIRAVFRDKIKEIPKIPVIDPDTGEAVTGADGQPLEIDRPIRLGDIDVRLVYSWDMFLQKKGNYEDVEYGAFRERVAVETLKAVYPMQAENIGADSMNTAYDAEMVEEQSYRNEVDVYHFFAKSTDLLDSGRYIKFTRTAILVNKKNPYIGWDDRAILPWARTVDIDTPGITHGDSIVTYGRPCQAVYNNIMSLHVRNMFLFAYPKWFMPRGAAKLESLGNDSTVVQYKGQTPPILAQPNLVNQGMDAVAMRAKEDMQQIMGVYGVSRGEPPAGVTAAVALTFLDEQESERASVGVAALMRSLKNVATQCLWLMSDHYTEGDKRLESLLGKTRTDEIAAFKMSNLRNVGDVKIQNATALPQQKAARLQYILDIRQQFPGIIPDEVAIDLLDLGEVEKLRNTITVAVRKALQENDILMNGKIPAAPEVQEFHLIHYRTHVRAMNEPYYGRLSPEVKKHHEEHVAAHEMFLSEQAMKNPQLGATIIAEFPGFPMFFKDPMAGLMPPMPMMPGPGGPPPGMPMPQPGPNAISSQGDMPAGAEAAMPQPQGMPAGGEAMMPQQQGET